MTEVKNLSPPLLSSQWFMQRRHNCRPGQWPKPDHFCVFIHDTGTLIHRRRLLTGACTCRCVCCGGKRGGGGSEESSVFSFCGFPWHNLLPGRLSQPGSTGKRAKHAAGANTQNLSSRCRGLGTYFILWKVIHHNFFIGFEFLNVLYFI